MADSDGKLSQEDGEKIKEWIRTYWKNGEDTPCPLCDNDEWVLNTQLMEMANAGALRSHFTRGGRVYYFVAVMCSRCAYIRLLNAKDIGVDLTLLDA